MFFNRANWSASVLGAHFIPMFSKRLRLWRQTTTSAGVQALTVLGICVAMRPTCVSSAGKTVVANAAVLPPRTDVVVLQEVGVPGYRIHNPAIPMHGKRVIGVKVPVIGQSVDAHDIQFVSGVSWPGCSTVGTPGELVRLVGEDDDVGEAGD